MITGGLNSFSRVDGSVAAAAAKLGQVLQRKLRICERYSLCPLVEGRIVNVQAGVCWMCVCVHQRMRAALWSAARPNVAVAHPGATAAADVRMPPPRVELTRQLSDVVPGVGVDDDMAVPAGGAGGNGSVPSSSPLAKGTHSLEEGASLTLLHFNDVCVAVMGAAVSTTPMGNTARPGAPTQAGTT